MKDQLPESLEHYRIESGPLASPPGARWGRFLIPVDKVAAPTPTFGKVRIILDDGRDTGWEHVSISISKGQGPENDETPEWPLMDWAKNVFWEDEEAVFQFHPPESEYVNTHPHVLHLWRPVDGEFPRPPSSLVGIT